MRNKIQLYIGTERADLDDNSFLLLNYTMEELSNPTIVKNSFSRQITLKGTPQNNKIFGGLYRNDRQTQYGSTETGVDFDPTRKTSFRIFNESGELLEDGYLKLDKIKTVGRRTEYTCTLYGSLGSFLYGLSYDSDGNKRTLADLDFGGISLDFTITRDTVADAWARLGGDITKDAKWAIINFAPTYNGLPPAPFDANKCYVVPWVVGLKTFDGQFRASQTIVTLNNKVTGNAARDYRSYLQKPVIKVAQLIGAICDPANNGGYTVNYDATFFDPLNPYWKDSWMTLPALNDLNIDISGISKTQAFNYVNTTLPIIGAVSGVVGVTIPALPTVDMTAINPGYYYMWVHTSRGYVANLLKYTVRLYDSNQVEIATATYRITTSGITLASEVPTPDFTCDHIDEYGYFVDEYGNRVTFPLYAEGSNAAYMRVDVAVESYYWGSATFEPGDQSGKMWPQGASLVEDGVSFNVGWTNVNADIVGSTPTSVRTGATITKANLLGGGRTPAEYLLSFCKMFGIQIVPHKGEKVIDLVLRPNFYNGTTVDINGRIDRGMEVEKTPFAFDARWYLFGNETKGEYAEYFQSRFNRPFGQYRVNTGYEFDAEEKEMTTDIVFGNLCSLVEASPYFCDIVDTEGNNVPPVFLSGGKYNLYNGSESKSLDLPVLTSAVKTWYNPSYPMHDLFEKLQVHGEQDSHLDERDTLVFFNGMVNTAGNHYSLTDDLENMLYLNGNTPCWLPNICDVVPEWELTEMPKFSRYVWSGDTINLQFDWGDPVELQIPGAMVGVLSNIFDGYWKKYISDRYDDDSAVVTCYVDFRGMQVGRDLFKQFYYFDGAVWALNRIINYSLTTSGPTQCEFVKVQNTTNYTNL